MTDRRPPPGALVTGGARGIGRAIVERLARRGDLVYLADLDHEAARRTAGELEEEGLAVLPLHLDVRDTYMVREMVAAANADHPLDTVVNNAGVGWITPLLETTPEDFDSLMGVNLRGAFFVLQSAAQAMVPRGRGAIVNLASTSAFTASTTPMILYDTSKAAVRMLTAAAARELAPHGVRVNAVAPGTVRTGLTEALGDPELLDRLAQTHIPMGRLGKPEEIAAVVDFLSSDAASYITGHTLAADGGWLT